LVKTMPGGEAEVGVPRAAADRPVFSPGKDHRLFLHVSTLIKLQDSLFRCRSPPCRCKSRDSPPGCALLPA
jgi:hypothetical protein